MLHHLSCMSTELEWKQSKLVSTPDNAQSLKENRDWDIILWQFDINNFQLSSRTTDNAVPPTPTPSSKLHPSAPTQPVERQVFLPGRAVRIPMAIADCVMVLWICHSWSAHTRWWISHWSVCLQGLLLHDWIAVLICATIICKYTKGETLIPKSKSKYPKGDSDSTKDSG